MSLKPVIMWAVVIKGSRSEWINHHTLAYLRCEARNRYNKFWDDPAVGPHHFKKKVAKLVKVRVEAA